MSYTKTIWQAGDTITSDKLNHLEGGGLRRQAMQK